MSSISGINSTNSYYSHIASGKKIQNAADGPSESAIIQKETAQINGYNAGTRNAEDGKSVLNIADAGLSGIADSLQRMRELAVQASNTAVVSDGDRKSIQKEIEQLKKHISDTANNTEFNTKKLLNGSNGNMHIASGANGDGMDIDTGNATLDALGIRDFDVTGKFDIKTIDNALKNVNSRRADIGAQTNALDYTINYNRQASYNLTNTTSKMEDTDIAKTITEQKKEQQLQSYRNLMQKKKMENDAHKLSMFQM